MTTTHPPELSHPAEVQQQLRRPRPGRPEVVATTAAEPTGTPGLVITPRLRKRYPGAWMFTGEWEVRHQHSGCVAVGVPFGTNLGHARDLAILLGELDVDWTRPHDRLPLHAHSVRSAVDDLRERLQAAIVHNRPLRLAQSSWVEVPPPYWVGTTDDAADEFFDSFAAAAEYVLTAQHLYTQGELVVGRCAAPEWHLHCAAVSCDASATDEYPALHRADAVTFAHDEGWRRLDLQHWLCGCCSSEFTAIPR